jgi:hypothetical protein
VDNDLVATIARGKTLTLDRAVARLGMDLARIGDVQAGTIGVGQNE